MVHVQNEHFATRQSMSAGSRPAFWRPGSRRFYMAMMMCLAVIAETFVKNTLNMSIVCMVNATALANLKKDNPDFTYRNNQTQCQVSRAIDSEYDGGLMWAPSTQSYLLSAIFWGGLVSGFPSGWIADRYSPKMVIFVCIILNLIGCVFVPLATEVGPWLVFVMRFIAGVGGQAAIFPTVTALCTRWIPPAERSTVIALYTSGVQIASIVGYPLNSFLCTKKNFLDGWPSIFYVNSGFVVVCGILWFFIVTNEPDKNKRISDKEREYIHRSLRHQGLKTSTLAGTKIPWKQIIFSPVMLVNVFSAFAGGTLVVIMTVYMPMYFKDIIHVDMNENGIYAALPFICEWVSKMLMAVIADWMKTRTRLSHTNICKMWNTIGMALPAVFLMLCAYVDCTAKSLPVLYICLASFFTSGVVPGFFTSLVCIAPQYTGIVNSYARTFGQISAVAVPLVIGNVVKQGTADEWKIIFIAIASFLFVATVLFLIFGSADIQPWAVIKIPDQQEDNLPHKPIVAVFDPSAYADKSELANGHHMSHAVSLPAVKFADVELKEKDEEGQPEKF